MIKTGEQRPSVFRDHGFLHSFPLLDCYQKVRNLTCLNIFNYTFCVGDNLNSILLHSNAVSRVVKNAAIITKKVDIVVGLQ